MAGDFNYPNINWKTNHHPPSCSAFLDALFEAGLQQQIDQPTRGSAILDLILVSDVNIMRELFIMEPLGKSDHCIVRADLTLNSYVPATPRLRYAFMKGDYDNFCRELEMSDWTRIFQQSNADDAWLLLKEGIWKAVANSVPLKRSKSRRGPVWET